MYNIIPLILILISLSIVIIIIVKKFPVLANLDVGSIPKEKEAKFKEQIISGRLKRNIIKGSFKLTRFIKPALQIVSNFFKWVYDKLHELKDTYKSQEVLPRKEAGKRADELLVEAGELIKNEELDMAEKKLIEIINLDNKNIEAFRTLGELYFERKNLEEAKQTFEHVIKLEQGESGEIYFDLSLVNRDMENLKEAADNIKKALEFEPNNPRYIDTALQISIINKDKVEALDAYSKLKEVNPDNQKLDEIKAQINEM